MTVLRVHMFNNYSDQHSSSKIADLEISVEDKSSFIDLSHFQDVSGKAQFAIVRDINTGKTWQLFRDQHGAVCEAMASAYPVSTKPLQSGQPASAMPTQPASTMPTKFSIVDTLKRFKEIMPEIVILQDTGMSRQTQVNALLIAAITAIAPNSPQLPLLLDAVKALEEIQHEVLKLSMESNSLYITMLNSGLGE